MEAFATPTSSSSSMATMESTQGRWGGKESEGEDGGPHERDMMGAANQGGAEGAFANEECGGSKGERHQGQAKRARQDGLGGFTEARRGRKCEDTGRPEIMESPLRSEYGTSLRVALHKRKRLGSEEKGGVNGCCNRCGGLHASEQCPHYPKGREPHKDAWANFGMRHGDEKAGVATGGLWTVERVQKMPADGNCMFHALVYGRDGLTTTHKAALLRMEIVAAIRANPQMELAGSSIEEWVRRDAGTGVYEYANRMARGAWGGGLELTVCAAVLGMAVRVFSPVAGSVKVRLVAVFGTEDPMGERTVAVLYVGGAHYDAVTVANDSASQDNGAGAKVVSQHVEVKGEEDAGEAQAEGVGAIVATTAGQVTGLMARRRRRIEPQEWARKAEAAAIVVASPGKVAVRETRKRRTVDPQVWPRKAATTWACVGLEVDGGSADLGGRVPAAALASAARDAGGACGEGIAVVDGASAALPAAMRRRRLRHACRLHAGCRCVFAGGAGA